MREKLDYFTGVLLQILGAITLIAIVYMNILLTVYDFGIRSIVFFFVTLVAPSILATILTEIKYRKRDEKAE